MFNKPETHFKTSVFPLWNINISEETLT